MAAIKFLALAALAGYLALAILVWAAQERLMFYPVAASGRPAAPAGWMLEEVRLHARDGTALAGVLVRPAATPAPLVVYYGGNAEEVTAYAASAAQAWGDRAVLLVNYRGYGASGGRPGEKALVSDAIEVLDWAARRPDVDAARIALHGRSLGSSVAVQVAAARAPRCLVLTSPFTSARDVARRAFPWLPVAWLLRHPFDSSAHAPRLAMPALFVTAERDEVIAPELSERLARRWGGPVEHARFPAGHNEVSLDARYDATIRRFLDRHL